MKIFIAYLCLAIFIIGCGPKLASQETYDRLTEAKIACRSAELRAKNLEAERIRLEEKLASKQEILESLKRQLQELEEGTEGK